MTPASTWEAVLLVAVPVFPLTLALLVGGRGRTATAALRVAPWAALPALGAVPWAAGAEIHIPWLVLGARWGLDDTGTAFLALTSFLWLCAGIYARDYLARASAQVN